MSSPPDGLGGWPLKSLQPAPASVGEPRAASRVRWRRALPALDPARGAARGAAQSVLSGVARTGPAVQVRPAPGHRTRAQAHGRWERAVGDPAVDRRAAQAGDLEHDGQAREHAQRVTGGRWGRRVSGSVARGLVSCDGYSRRRCGGKRRWTCAIFRREGWTAETGWSRSGARSTVDFMAVRRLGLSPTNNRRSPDQIARGFRHKNHRGEADGYVSPVAAMKEPWDRTWSGSAIRPRPAVHLCKVVGGNRPIGAGRGFLSERPDYSGT